MNWTKRQVKLRLALGLLATLSGCASARHSQHVSSATTHTHSAGHVGGEPSRSTEPLSQAVGVSGLASHAESSPHNMTATVIQASLVQTATNNPATADDASEEVSSPRDSKPQADGNAKAVDVDVNVDASVTDKNILSAPAESFPIDLATALRLGNADNVQVNLAREQMQQAYIEYQQSGMMWLPSLRSGIHYNKHEGPLLSSSGDMRDTSRGSIYAGAGAAAVGGGSPAIPGLLVNFHLADAIFQPLAMQQRWGARDNAATATRNDTLLNISLAYLELLRAYEDRAIAADVYEKMREVSRLTDAYLKAGQGLAADADRMRVELGLRELDVLRSEEAIVIASARLSQLLRLQSCCRLTPLEPEVIELNLVRPTEDCCSLVSRALQTRPELRQSQYLVGEAVERLKRERYAPLVPSVLLGTSYGGFGGGSGSRIGNFDDRLDFDASAFWEIRNLGFGEQAAQKNARSRVRQSQLQELAVMDQVAREVTEARAQVELRQQQIGTAKQLVRLANDSYDQNLIRIKNGQGLPIETLQSVQALLQSRRELLRTLTDYNSSQFTLQRAMGWPVDQPLAN